MELNTLTIYLNGVAIYYSWHADQSISGLGENGRRRHQG